MFSVMAGMDYIMCQLECGKYSSSGFAPDSEPETMTLQVIPEIGREGVRKMREGRRGRHNKGMSWRPLLQAPGEWNLPQCLKINS